MPMRLSDATLASLPGTVARPAYDRAATRVGIVHLGAGAFHRAHQAVYVDDLLAADPDWAICAVSLHSAGVRDALRPQDGLYTLVLLGEQPRLRVIGSIREVLCARDEREAVLARLADPAVRLVTLTVTEKGYCLSGEDLDFEHPEIAHDLAAPDAPDSAIGYLVAGLKQRKAQGISPYTVLSCDNLADNGGKLRRAVLQFTQRLDSDLAGWIEREVAFPRSMVDSVTPATDDALRERVTAALSPPLHGGEGEHLRTTGPRSTKRPEAMPEGRTGQGGDGFRLVDAWPIQREPYTQWVVEDDFRNGRPPFERAGVILSNDIAGYDQAKLRLLNGPHSTLAYFGSLMDIETVADAMRTPALAGLVERLMREDIAPTLNPPAGFDPDTYITAILDRFRNSAIRHLLSQIAWDGSQKLPVRILPVIGAALVAGRPIDRLCLPIAAWLHFVRRQTRNGVTLVDPLNDILGEIARNTTGDAANDVAAFLALDVVFAGVRDDVRFVEALRNAYGSLDDGSPGAVARVLAAALDAASGHGE